MRIAFLHVESTYKPEEIEIQRLLAQRLIKSVRDTMGCEIVQLTDTQTKMLDGVDVSVIKDLSGKHWMEYVLEHIICLPPETLYIDTDCVVQEDVSCVFDSQFDVALSGKRARFAQYIDLDGVKHLMPLLGGVVFCRNPGYWEEIREELRLMTDPMMKAWWGVQALMWTVYQRNKHDILLLDSQIFNYTPNKEDEDLSGKAVVHYKGNHRKHWNLETTVRLPRERDIPLGVL